MTDTTTETSGMAAGAAAEVEGQQQTLQAMQVLLSAGVPVLLWGDPGTGKTATVERYAAEMGWTMEPLIASLHDPTDFSGLPVRNGDTVVYVPPEWALRVAHSDEVSLVFLDEVNTAPPATQNALMRVVQENRVGYLCLGERVRFVAAANPVEQNSGAWDLSAPLANRFAHLDWPLRLDEWRSGYLDGWPDLAPLDIDTAAAAARGDVDRCRRQQTEFLTRRPQLLCDVPDTSTSPRGWPSPRSWERLALCTALAAAAGAADATLGLIAVALIGEAAAAEFLAYLENPDLPDPHHLLSDPSKFADIARSDQQLAVLNAVAAAAFEHPERWQDAFKVCIAAAETGAADIAAATAMRLAENKPPKANLPKGWEAFSEILTEAGLLTAKGDKR